MAEQAFPTDNTVPTSDTNPEFVSSSTNSVATLTILGFDVAIPTNSPDFKDTQPYDTYLIDTEVYFDNGLVQLPGTGYGSSGSSSSSGGQSSGNVSSVVAVSGGMMRMTVTWVASRTGAPPVLPAYFSEDANMVPLHGAIIAKEVIPSADGASLRYFVSGSYTYAILDPSKFQLVPCLPPFLSDEVAAGALAGFKYYTNVFKFSGASGSNPFIQGGSVNNIIPKPSAAYINEANSFIGLIPSLVGSILGGTTNDTGDVNKDGLSNDVGAGGDFEDIGSSGDVGDGGDFGSNGAPNSPTVNP